MNVRVSTDRTTADSNPWLGNQNYKKKKKKAWLFDDARCKITMYKGTKTILGQPKGLSLGQRIHTSNNKEM